MFVIKYPIRLILYGNLLGVKYPELSCIQSMAEVNLWTINYPTYSGETKGDVNGEQNRLLRVIVEVNDYPAVTGSDVYGDAQILVLSEALV